MLQAKLPRQVEPFKLVKQTATLSGQLPLTELEHLQACLSTTIGTVAVELVFTLDEQDKPVIKGHLKTCLALICQRCLQAVSYPIDNAFCVYLVLTDNQAKQLPAEHEPLLVENDSISVVKLIEDELILQLPMIAMHDDANCSAVKHTDRAVSQTSPFAILKNLKKEE